MTRIKESVFETDEVPDYKSPPSRIVRSLYKGYNNLRGKIAEKAETTVALQGKLRDTQRSRDDWKNRAKSAEAKLIELEKKYSNTEEVLKKRKKSSC